MQVLKRKQATEFENWIARIILQAGGTKARNVAKAISNKHLEFVNAANGGTAKDKNNPMWDIHPALWALAKPKIGST